MKKIYIHYNCFYPSLKGSLYITSWKFKCPYSNQSHNLNEINKHCTNLYMTNQKSTLLQATQPKSFMIFNAGYSDTYARSIPNTDLMIHLIIPSRKSLQSSWKQMYSWGNITLGIFNIRLNPSNSWLVHHSQYIHLDHQRWSNFVYSFYLMWQFIGCDNSEWNIILLAIMFSIIIVVVYCIFCNIWVLKWNLKFKSKELYNCCTIFRS